MVNVKHVYHQTSFMSLPPPEAESPLTKLLFFEYDKQEEPVRRHTKVLADGASYYDGKEKATMHKK